MIEKVRRLEKYFEQVAVSCAVAAEWMASYRLRHTDIFTGAKSVDSACVHMASCERKGNIRIYVHAAINTMIM
jgi:hypothetical protein